MPKYSKKNPRSASDSRNPSLSRGLLRYGAAKAASRNGRWAVKNKKAAAAKKDATKEVKKTIKGAKNGNTRVIGQKIARYYSVEDAPRRLHSNKPAAPTTQALKKNLVPGTVLVLLAGRFRGKRVVFLKQLESGLLLVTGPFKVNGVPLRRVNQVYTQTTSTKVDVAGLKLDKFNDAYFKRPAQKAAKKSEAEFLKTEEKPKNEIAAGRKADQKEVDSALLKTIAKVAHLKQYMGARFSLTKGQFPHEMKF